MNLPHLAWIVQVATTLPLVGLIWFVQLDSYPLMARVGAAEFVRYHQSHVARVSYVVGPLMVAEIVAAIVWAVDAGGRVTRPVALTGLALVAFVWGVTALASVPLHDVLARGFDGRAHRLLVATNWLRTIAWTLRGALLVTVLTRHAG